MAHDGDMNRMSAVSLAVLFVLSCVPGARAEDVDGPHRRVRVTLRSADMGLGLYAMRRAGRLSPGNAP